jgi:predicted DNA-binding transcriptional regulator YafY
MNGQHIPYKLEYSAKDDKFRLETASGRYSTYINLARVEGCELLEPYFENELIPPRRRECSVTFMLTDERNALDRVMLHFSDCRKETRRVENDRYQVILWYEAQDETEMLIRVLSFGPMLKVTAPDSFIGLIKNRLSMQQSQKI